MVQVPPELPPPIGRDTPAFRRMMMALVAVGFSAFALLYGMQPLLPVFTVEFHRSPAEAALALSAATGALAVCLVFSALVADRVERRLMMVVCLVAAAILTLAVAFAPNWEVLLTARALTGVALSGVPAVAVTYIAEEVDSDAIGLAVGLHIAGNVFGGMSGRLVTGMLAEHIGWRGAVLALAVIALLSTVLLRLSLPASRRFTPRRRSLLAAMSGFASPFRDRGMPWLFLEAFLLMGSFIAIYNYLGFRLLAPPYKLNQTVVGLIFAFYLLGVFSSPWVGDLAGRLGRRRVLWIAVGGMLAGTALTAAQPLVLVVAGLVVLTFCFFGAHSVASSWLSRRAGTHRAQASSIYMVCYYMGSSLIGYAGGLAWTAAAWPGVLVLVGAALALGLVVAIGLSFLEPLPGNLPSGAAEKLGS